MENRIPSRLRGSSTPIRCANTFAGQIPIREVSQEFLRGKWTVQSAIHRRCASVCRCNNSGTSMSRINVGD
jgi:hypothetical protein